MKFKKQLQSLEACSEAIRWVGSKSLKEAWNTCERGDWMLWYYFRAKGFDKHLVKAKADCASLVKHLMIDPRSFNALQSCYDYVDGKISIEELRIAANSAYRAADAAYTVSVSVSDAAADASYDAARAAYRAAAADAASAASDAAAASAAAYRAAAYTVSVSDAAADAAATAHAKTLKECADICREVLTKSLFTEKLTNTKT